MEKDKNQLKVLKCRQCQGLFVAPKYNCPQCSGTSFESVGVTGEGTLRTYTTIRVPPLGFEKQAPYTIGVVELQEGTNITARLVVQDGVEPTIGKKVKFLRSEKGMHWFQYCG